MSEEIDSCISWTYRKYIEKYDKIWLLRKGIPTKRFWDIRNQDKEKIKKLGYTIKKDPTTNHYEVNHWHELTNDEIKEYQDRKKEKKEKKLPNDNIAKFKYKKYDEEDVIRNIYNTSPNIYNKTDIYSKTDIYNKTNKPDESSTNQKSSPNNNKKLEHLDNDSKFRIN